MTGLGGQGDLPPGYPQEYVRLVTLRDGRSVLIRPILPSDAPVLAEAIESADADTIRRRFLGGRPQVTPGLLDYLTTVDYTSRLALLAVGGVPAPDQCQPHVTNGRRTTATASSPSIRRYPMIHSPAPASAPPTAGCGPSAGGRGFPDATGR